MIELLCAAIAIGFGVFWSTVPKQKQKRGMDRLIDDMKL